MRILGQLSTLLSGSSVTVFSKETKNYNWRGYGKEGRQKAPSLAGHVRTQEKKNSPEPALGVRELRTSGRRTKSLGSYMGEAKREGGAPSVFRGTCPNPPRLSICI